MGDYGVWVYRYGIHFHGDRRWRRASAFGATYLVPEMVRRDMVHARELGVPYVKGRLSKPVPRGTRKAISAFSPASARRLEFIAANAGAQFQTILTLTYHARVGSWEDVEGRNRRIVMRSKKDLNRFLTCVRKELGQYLWVQEFQERGVIHYHLLCTGAIDEPRAKVAWLRAIESVNDEAASRYGVKVELVRSEGDVRRYLGRYLGKGRQKRLPMGVHGAGRWWGRSRGIDMGLLREVVSNIAGDDVPRRPEVQIVRAVRRFMSKAIGSKKHGFQFLGGLVVDWGGQLSASVTRIIERLQAYYGVPFKLPEILAEFGSSRDQWEAKKRDGWLYDDDDGGPGSRARVVAADDEWRQYIAAWEREQLRRAVEAKLPRGTAEEEAEWRDLAHWAFHDGEREALRARLRANQARLALDAGRGGRVSRGEQQEDSAHGHGGHAASLSDADRNR